MTTRIYWQLAYRAARSGVGETWALERCPEMYRLAVALRFGHDR